MFSGTAFSSFFAVDAATGEEVWAVAAEQADPPRHDDGLRRVIPTNHVVTFGPFSLEFSYEQL